MAAAVMAHGASAAATASATAQPAAGAARRVVARPPPRARRAATKAVLRCVPHRIAATEAVAPEGGSDSAKPSWFEAYMRVSSMVTNLFPVWTVIAALLALKRPETFLMISTDKFTAALAVLMFSMGITMTVEDFKRVVRQPKPVAINFVCCYVVRASARDRGRAQR